LTPLRLNPAAVSWLEIDGEILALQHSSSEYLSTNAAGARLWKLLTDGTSREQLIAMLVEHYGIDEDRAAADTDAFLGELAAHGLLAV
jgi:hypothetical protein